MTTFKRYFCYRLRKSKLQIIIFTVLAVWMTHFSTMDAIEGFHLEGYGDVHQAGLSDLHSILVLCCTIIPIVENSCFKNRRNLDTLYCLPISRPKLALAHYLCGWAQVMIIYTASFAWCTVLLLSHREWFHLSYLFPYYLLSLLMGLIVYSVFSFLFGEANSEGDGIMFVFFGIFAFMWILYSIGALISGNLGVFEGEWKFVDWDWGIASRPITRLTALFQSKIHLHPLPPYQSDEALTVMREWYMFTVWGIIGIASAIGYFFTFVRRGAERIGDISNSWFGYKTMIPIYAYGMIFLLGDGNAIFTIFLLIVMTLFYAIYRRSFRLKKSDLICVLLGFLPWLAGGIFLS